MSQVTLLAEFEVKTQDLDLFIAAAKREMQAVGASAAGCLGFEVLLFDEETGKGAFVEVFKDQAAADAHRETPHFSEFFEEIEDIEVTWSVRRGTAVSVNQSSWAARRSTGRGRPRVLPPGRLVACLGNRSRV